MNTTQCRPTGPALPSVHPAEELVDIPSEYITGRTSNVPKAAADVCLKPSVIGQFWREAVKAIRAQHDSDRDGVVYTSDGIDVYLGPWDVEVRHTYRWVEQPGGDSYMEIAEPYAELVERFEVVGAHDYDNDIELHGVVRTLNDYYKNHENEILKLR